MPKPDSSILTPNQQEVLRKIQAYIGQHAQSPTISELKELIGVASLRSVTQYLESLENKGLLIRKRYQNRGIELIDQEDRQSGIVTIPVVANAGCDNLSVYADENSGEHVSVARSFLRGYDPKQVVAIRAIGNSMEEAGIKSGDLVLTEVTQNVKEGEDIVAIIDDKAVIKRVRFTDNAVILNPVSNDSQYHPIIMRNDFQVSGRVIEVIKNKTESDLVYELED